MREHNVLFISYGDIEYDGRLRELIKISESLGTTTIITTTNENNNKVKKYHKTIKNGGIFSYLSFILFSIQVSIKVDKTDILFLDNRKAIIPGIIIKRLKKPGYIIQDVRELYLKNEVNYLSGKIGCILEQHMLKKTDIIISANDYRAKIMEEHFKLKSKPLVYENLRKLEYTTDVNLQAIEEKYGHYFTRDTIRIISTSGCIISRTNDVLVKAMEKLGEGYELFLVGQCLDKDYKIIKQIMKESKIDNVNIINKLGLNELKYFINNSHIGIVNYHQKDLNNKYCASGKLYEFAFDGLPVVTTENIPLKDLCNKYGIGVSDNQYVNGIKKVKENYSYYKENVLRFTNNNKVLKNNDLLIKTINKLLQ